MERPTELAGREADVAHLEAALAGVARGGTPALAITGQPGIGKTRLLSEAATRADQRGWTALVGRATELERELPFGVFVDALDAFAGSLPGPWLDTLSPEQRAELAAVFPALAGLAGRRKSQLQQERYHAHHAVRQLLELIAERTPLLLALDDLHWADEASIELVAHLLRRPPAGAVLVIAFRPARASANLQAALAAAEREGTLERIELEPLSLAAAECVLDPQLPPTVRAAIHAASGGNPFYLLQLSRARGLPGAGAMAADDEGDGALPVPQAVGAALRDELRLLSARARLVVQAAAVAGEPFVPDLVADVAAVGEDEALAAIDEAVERDLVHPGESPRQFRFRHPIVRRAVYESAGDGWRIAAHGRAAEALRARGAPPAARAHHVNRSARSGDAEAIAVLEAAAEATAPLAPATAARWLGAALRLLAPEADATARLRLLVPMAAALGSSGQLDAARATLGEVIALLPPEAGAVRGRVAGFVAVIDHLRGRHGAAGELLERCLRELPADAPAEAASVQLELASDRYFAGDWEGMQRWAQPAYALACTLPRTGLRASAAAVLGLAEYSMGRIDVAERLMTDAERDVAAGDGDLRLDAFDWVGWCELSMERYESAIGHFREGLAIGRRTGQGHLLMTMRFGVVLSLSSLGRLADAIEESEAALDLARMSGSEQLMSWALALRSQVELRRGAVGRAIALGDEARQLAGEVSDNPFSAVGGAWLGEAHVEAGAPARGREALLAALGGTDLPRIEVAFRPYLYDVLARAELALGEIERASTWAERAWSVAERTGLPGRRAWALRARASVALARGEATSAAELAAEGRIAALSAGHRIDAARCQALGGVALATAGARDRGVAELQAARAELDALGAERERDRVTRELRRLGLRVGRGGARRRAEWGIEALSGREEEVARLVCERLTNREIAEHLVLSEKTIERHLSSVFCKLRASSRVEVARMMERGAISS